MVEVFKKSSNMFQYIFTKNQFFFPIQMQENNTMYSNQFFYTTTKSSNTFINWEFQFMNWYTKYLTENSNFNIILQTKNPITSNIYYFCESGINYFVSVFILSVDSIDQENSSRNRFFILLQEITTKVKSLQCFLFFL